MYIQQTFLGVLMILAGSLEFEKGHNNEIQERPSDNEELPEVRHSYIWRKERQKSHRPIYYSCTAPRVISSLLLQIPEISTELLSKPYNSKECQKSKVKKNPKFYFVYYKNIGKQMVLCKSTAEEVSFEW